MAPNSYFKIVRFNFPAVSKVFLKIHSTVVKQKRAVIRWEGIYCRLTVSAQRVRKGAAECCQRWPFGNQTHFKYSAEFFKKKKKKKRVLRSGGAAVSGTISRVACGTEHTSTASERSARCSPAAPQTGPKVSRSQTSARRYSLLSYPPDR